MASQDSSLAGLLARYQVAGDRRMWLKAVDSATERGDDRGRSAAERALAQLPDIDVFDSIRAGAELVRRISGWRWLDIRQAREEGRPWSEIGDAWGCPSRPRGSCTTLRSSVRSRTCPTCMTPPGPG